MSPSILKTTKNSTSKGRDSFLPYSADDMSKAYWHGNADTWKNIVDPPLYEVL